MFGRGRILAKLEELERKLQPPAVAVVPLPNVFSTYTEPSETQERREWLGGVVSFYDTTFRTSLEHWINQTHQQLAQTSNHRDVDLLRGHLSALYSINDWFIACQGELETLISN